MVYHLQEITCYAKTSEALAKYPSVRSGDIFRFLALIKFSLNLSEFNHSPISQGCSVNPLDFSVKSSFSMDSCYLAYLDSK